MDILTQSLNKQLAIEDEDDVSIAHVTQIRGLDCVESVVVEGQLSRPVLAASVT